MRKGTVSDMVTDKDRSLLNFLTDQTRGGSLNWQPTAEENQFTVSIKGKYSVVMGDRGGGYTYLKLINENEQQLVEISSLDTDMVEPLYEFVRRKALDVDRAIDDILSL